MARISRLLLSPLLVVAVPCLAGDESAKHLVSLADALAAADRLPELVAAQASVRAAEARVRVAGALGQTDLSIQTNSITARQEAAVSIPIPIARGPRLQAARADQSLASRSREEIL